MICDVMKAAKGVSYRLTWQGLLSCELNVPSSCGDILLAFVLNHKTGMAGWFSIVNLCRLKAKLFSFSL
jgi:hypothetical protein